MVEAYGQLPLYFVENQGQTDAVVDYIVNGNDTTLYFSSQGVTLAVVSPDTNATLPRLVRGRRALTVGERPGPQRQRRSLKLDFIGGRSGGRPVAQEPTPAVASYFKGPREQWKTGLRTYARLVYPEVWPGIDVEFSGTVNRLKYSFALKPGADPHKIRLGYRGASGLRISATGKLEVTWPAGVFHDDMPIAFQELDGKRVPVPVDSVLDSPAASVAPDHQTPATYRFQLGAYDPTRTLIIDPAIFIYSRTIGDAGDERGLGIEVDAAGDAYVCGQTTSTGFPVAVGPDLTFNGDLDAYVLKLDPTGTRLIYAGYIGGARQDGAFSIAVDPDGSAYIGGFTTSREATFPVRGGPGLLFRGGTLLGLGMDAFVAKVAPDGRNLLYCGYIGSDGDEAAEGVALDAAGNLYVTGYTTSTEASFPVAVGPDLTHNGGWNTFVAKVKPDGSGLAYCGYIGGSDHDCFFIPDILVSGGTIAVDNEGSAYVASFTGSSQNSFPNGNGFASLGIPGPDQTFHGDSDAFAAKVRHNGDGLVWCGYIGGSGFDGAFAIAVDREHNAYVAGLTGSSEATFPVKGGPDLHFHGGRPPSEDGDAAVDAFVAKLDPTGTRLIYCGYIGGAKDEGATNLRVDAAGNAYIVGYTESSEATFPVTGGPNLTFGGEVDAFAAKLKANPTNSVVRNNFEFLSYVGSSGVDAGYDIAVDAADDAYVCGDAPFSLFAGSSLFVVKIVSGVRLVFEPPPGFVPGGFRLSICGTAGALVRIQRSVNLRDWKDWRSVRLSGSLTELTDLNAGTNATRFYRAVAP